MTEINYLFEKNLPTPVQQIMEPQFGKYDVQVFLKRDDLIHPDVSGNKWRKLKYNLLEAQRQGFDTILTFGGAYSNHIAATAAACRIAGLKSIGIIRGEELREGDNPTLFKARQCGMHLEFVTRESYRRKNEPDFLQRLKEKFGESWIIPEGGANQQGIRGCMEVMDELNQQYDFICVACGTGTTMAGILSASKPGMRVMGFPVFKNGMFIENELNKLLSANRRQLENYQLMIAYHFGGYARCTPELIRFMKDFESQQGIALDFVYTGKMMFGIYDLDKRGFFPQRSKILAIHTGGLQGNYSIRNILKD